uniref:Piwi domain-containing protein n=1 Tax=Panagrolaimus sp. JU765 TaxID=591449 RepID=A0AC34QIA8_9BILA
MTDSEFSKVYFLIGVDENKMIHKYDVNISFQNNQGYLIMTNQLDEMTKFKNFKIIEYVMTNKCFLYDLEQQLFTPNQIDEIIDLEIPTNVLPANIFEESGCSEWKQLFQGCQNGFISYYMIVGDLQKNHYELKAAEALTSGVVTQHIKNATVEEGTKDRFIIKTIIHKINEKAGGLNFALKFNENSGNLNLNEKDEKVLVIGLSMSHSIEGDQAGSLAVGFSANYESEPCHFRGHCFSQSSQTKVIDFEQLRDSLEETIRRFYERNDCYPDRIVIIRNAESSELQNDIIDVEFDEIRQVVVNLCQNKPVLTFILLNKVEMTFLSSIEMPNLPGTFINKDDTNNQFYFIFEMKKIPQAFLATVFIDNSDNDLTLKQVKHFIHGLGHLSYHPRYDMPLPKPIDQAIYWAEHGRSLFNIIGQLEPDIKKLNLF